MCLIEFLCESLAVLWKDWPMDMQAVTLAPPHGLYSLRGSCPHCRERSVFVTSLSGNNQPAIHNYPSGNSTVSWAILQCQGCLNFVLGCCVKGQGQSAWTYSKHFPVGNPDDSVANEVPAAIAADFKEALRCRWLDCFKATLIMCRRSIESSCVDLKAKGGRLIDKIDDLAASGTITISLKDMAHQVRLEGNIGAHANDTTLADLDAGTVDAVISFVREYFHHVYVMPAKLAAVKAKNGP